MSFSVPQEFVHQFHANVIEVLDLKHEQKMFPGTFFARRAVRLRWGRWWWRVWYWAARIKYPALAESPEREKYKI